MVFIILPRESSILVFKCPYSNQTIQNYKTMKIKYLFCGLFLLGLSACNYLDIVPDEVVKEEDSYETPDLVRNYLYSCYSFLPTNRAISNNAYWMMCGAETSFYRKEMFSTFNEGTYGPSSLHMTSDTWSPIWEGIRQ